MSIGVDVRDKCTPAECHVLERSDMGTLLEYLYIHIHRGIQLYDLDHGFALHMCPFLGKIASAARSYRGRRIHISKVNRYN